ncbi:chemokine (C-C motif) ligand 28 [Rattus norvegicus]|uniref:C-C motif chemokine n=2 Tax=Rattus norvegicus TaxID=10116 RepID=A6I5W4_RAT|nr:C-C motif chemokine 28 precursor [Rattus norvegicus]EDM10422.1 chemokine (C-C motif) ligand 28 [Rattus norvegicus]
MQQAGLTLVAVAVCVAFRTSEAILPIASSCCTEVSHHIPRRLLERVNSCSIQRADGDCDLAAVILHVKRRRICVSPHNPTLKRWMSASEMKNGKENLCPRKKQDSGKDRKGHTPRKHGKHGTRRIHGTHGHEAPR